MLRNVHQYKDGMVWELGGVYEGAAGSQVSVICGMNLHVFVSLGTYNFGEVVLIKNVTLLINSLHALISDYV